MFYIRKSKGIMVVEAWFQPPASLVRRKYVASFLHNIPPLLMPDEGEYVIRRRIDQTLISDLAQSAEELMLRCERNVRNEIRRAKKDGAQCRHYAAEELRSREDLLRQFDKAHMEMHRSKGMAASSALIYMQQLLQANMLSISTCSIGDQIAAYHVYIIGDGIARLLYSVSVFRDTEDGALRSAIGRGNRMLHYEDMLWLKGQGYPCCDWGGYATDPALESINAFKRGFGGEVHPRSYMVITSKRWARFAYLVLEHIRGTKK